MHTARNFPTTDTYGVTVEGWIQEDIEIDSVWMVYRDREPEMLDPLSFDLWGSSFVSSHFNTDDPTMMGVLGQPFVISFAVHGDRIYSLDSLFMIRVMEAVPELISPMSRDTVDSRPGLVWNDFGAPFEYGYLVQVWRNEPEFQVRAWSSDTLDADTTELTVGISLANGNYYWVLFAIDEFINYSRSREGEFVVYEESL